MFLILLIVGRIGCEFVKGIQVHRTINEGFVIKA